MSVELRQMIEAVCRSVPLNGVELPDQFFPAHVTVALLDAVLRSPLEDTLEVVPGVERYCHRFGVARTRVDRWSVAPPEEQESLTDLVGRFDELGVGRMAAEVFPARPHGPGAPTPGAESVLRAAGELRRIGVEVLQDVAAAAPEAVEGTLRSSDGAGEHAGRLLLMYTGDDDFVRGDSHVCRFVAHATGRKSVSPERAEHLVRQCAYEMILSPRYLDHEIWRYGVSFLMAGG